ncbi:MAG TPA: hypothetical protein VNI20_10545 [Fimbriimonadaceae bacterium]|nr:hypothetical protein [Fimbriimonadaceae bacterium]
MWANTANAQSVNCVFKERLADVLYGSCSGLSSDESLITLRPKSHSSQDWIGAITLGNYVELVEVVAQETGPARTYTFRSVLNWFNVQEWHPNRMPAVLRFDRSDVAAPTDTDVAILKRARALIMSSRWDRADDRNCENDEKGTLSLYCALMQASYAETGQYYHRQPAMQLVRRAIQQQWPERVKNHRLMDFNNAPETTSTDLITVIDIALETARDGKVQKK